jgi:anti-anti-sigma factor
VTEQHQNVDDAWSVESGAPESELVLSLEGEMTIGRALELKQSLMTALRKLGSGASIRVDLAAVSEMDSSGVQLLLLARELAAMQAAKLSLVPVSAPVRRVLEFLNLCEAFEISPSPSEEAS